MGNMGDACRKEGWRVCARAMPGWAGKDVHLCHCCAIEARRTSFCPAGAAHLDSIASRPRGRPACMGRHSVENSSALCNGARRTHTTQNTRGQSSP
jgi:hypothetical protein